MNKAKSAAMNRVMAQLSSARASMFTPLRLPSEPDSRFGVLHREQET
jgi:hypothetical protein